MMDDELEAEEDDLLLSNMSASDYSNLVNCQGKVQKFLTRDHMVAEEKR